MGVTELLTEWTLADLTDVTLEDIFEKVFDDGEDIFEEVFDDGEDIRHDDLAECL